MLNELWNQIFFDQDEGLTFAWLESYCEIAVWAPEGASPFSKDEAMLQTLIFKLQLGLDRSISGLLW